VSGCPKVRFGLAALVVGAAVLALFALAVVSVVRIVRGDTSVTLDRPVQAATLTQRFAILSRLHSNKCGLRPESLDSIAAGGRLQGSCCSPMTLQHYLRQVRKLGRYADVPEVPPDPYDISVRLAKRLTAYDKRISLAPGQQTTYDQAVKMADEHGPCCCHCWRWTAFEGQAKYLITRRRYAAGGIARIWDLEDGCGGT
jgi:hypothetical protein